MVRVGAIDCGTNSLRLLVADVEGQDGQAGVSGEYDWRGRIPRGTATEVLRRTEVVRLGQGVDATGAFDPAAIARALALTGEYARECARLGVRRMRFVATSATRDAANASALTDGVATALAGWHCVPEVISGRQEALLSFRGATGGLASAGLRPPYLVVDVGGGSTELVLGGDDVTGVVSLDVGSVRLTERCVRCDPPGPGDVIELTAHVDTALTRAADVMDLAAVHTLVGTGGTVTTVAAHALGLATYQRDRVHLSRIAVPRLLGACASLAAMPRADRAALGFMHPGRVDVIAAGALIWGRIVEVVAARSGVAVAVASEHDILDGIALSLA